MEQNKTPPDSANTSIPILKCDKVLSDDKWYMLRLTPFEEYQDGDVKELLNMFSAKIWIYSKEVSKGDKIHYHTLFQCYKDPREDIKEWLQTFFTDKWKKEDGNKRYNLTEVDDINKAVTYVVKDGDYFIGDHINTSYVENCKKKSFKKYSKEAFASAFEELKTEFREDKIDHLELRTKFIRLKATYGQPVDSNRITGIINSLRVQKDPSLATEF